MKRTSAILSYEALNDRQGRWRRFVKALAIVFSVAVCVAPVILAFHAWITHFAWLRSGAYERNSFPMKAFAREMTWVSAGCIFAVALAWSIKIWWRLRAVAREPAAGANHAGGARTIKSPKGAPWAIKLPSLGSSDGAVTIGELDALPVAVNCHPREGQHDRSDPAACGELLAA